MTQRVSINYKIITILLGSLLYASLSWSARLPDFTQLVEQASPAVVNISTSRVAAQRPTGNPVSYTHLTLPTNREV